MSLINSDQIACAVIAAVPPPVALTRRTKFATAFVFPTIPAFRLIYIAPADT